jgi:uncharacterized protein YceK
MKESLFTSVILTIAVTISGCSSTTTSSSPTINTSTSNGVVGFGATSDTWNAHHIADVRRNVIPGSGYDPDPNLNGGIGTDRYSTVEWSNGIVIGYTMALLDGTKLNEAKAAALAEMPKDAKISFFYVQDKSATLETTSAILKPILVAPSIGSLDGSVDFVFCSVANDGTSSFNPANINSIWVSFGLGLAPAKGTIC